MKSWKTYLNLNLNLKNPLESEADVRAQAHFRHQAQNPSDRVDSSH